MPKEKKKRSFRHTNTFYRKRDKLLMNLKNTVALPRTEPSILNGHEKVTGTITQECENDLADSCNDLENLMSADESDDKSSAASSENYFSNEESDEISNEWQQKEIFKKKLREWAIKHSLSEAALRELLVMLTNEGIKDLPADPRTLLKRPKKVVLEAVGGAQMWYQGIKACLQTISFTDDVVELKLNFNMDGLPIAKSSKQQFWPILMSIANIPNISPLVVAIWCGNSKPENATLFLRKFVDELNDLIQTGYQASDDRILQIKINAIICDTPARSFIKCIVSHTAYFSCQKCTIKGKYHCSGRHISFPDTDCELRTDESFRVRSNPEHHQKNNATDEFLRTPLEDLPIDMIRDIPIADALHLIDLGLMKRCLIGWVKGSYNFREKLFAPQVNEISLWLKNSNLSIPSEFHRSVRELDTIAFWKGTELRVFLLYLGPVILKDHLSKETYDHFLLLSCAITILSSDFYATKLQNLLAAESMLNDYIDTFIILYGIDAISSNVHNLCHIVEDVRRFGSLNKISSYIFENKLGMFKKLLKKGHQSLAQIAKRIIERSSIATKNKTTPVSSVFKYEIGNSYKIPGVRVLYKSVRLSGVKFQVDKKNQWFLTKKNKVVKMLGAFQLKGKTYLYGCSLKDLSNFYEYPFKSSQLNVFISDHILNPPNSYLEQEIKCKLISLKYKDKLVFFPLLHSLDIFNGF